MAIPSFDELLNQARELSESNADAVASVRSNDLMAKGLSDFVSKLMVPQDTDPVVAEINREGQFTSYPTPRNTQLPWWVKSRAKTNEPGAFPVRKSEAAGLFTKTLPVTVLDPTTGKTITQTYGRPSFLKPEKKPPLSTQGAIESGYASRDFVKSIIPDLDDSSDIPVGELNKRVALIQQQNAQNAPKPIASEQIDKIASMRSAITGADNIRTRFFSLAGKGKSPVDPIKGRWEQLKSSAGFGSDPEIETFKTDVVAELNTYLNSISGAAITAQEADRLRMRLPGIDMTSEQFLGRLDSFYDELNRSLGSRVQTLKDAGYRIGDLDQFLPTSGPKKKSPSTGTTKNGMKFTVER